MELYPRMDDLEYLDIPIESGPDSLCYREHLEEEEDFRFKGTDPDNYKSSIITNYTNGRGQGEEILDIWVKFNDWDGEELFPTLLSDLPAVHDREDCPICSLEIELENEGWEAYLYDPRSRSWQEEYISIKFMLENQIAPNQPVKLRMYSKYTCDYWGEYDAEFYCEVIDMYSSA
jgi:hypothetical protein